ncbi:hypothetical protein V8F20_001133 [Naviculisporaceae sp. PSN 640]
MSRALDKKVLASLQKPDPSAAYQAISEVLSSPSHDRLLEIEILGSTHGLPDGVYVLQEGTAVGVSKLGLVMAFLVARKLLAAHLDATSRKSDDELLTATAVILLMDPEYLTAANTRKRIVQRQLLDGENTAERVFIKEKHIIDSLLTSRLHRHTKSPTLWSHRRWLLQTQASLHIPTSVLSDLTDVVFVAGERHPRNYYAWCHARFLVGLGDEKMNQHDVLEAVKTWCFKHHTDISGWTFLYYLLNRRKTLGYGAASSLISTQVLKLVESLRLSNESIWVFLRTLAAGRHLSDTDYDRFLAVSRDILEKTVDETDKRVLESAVDWCKTYRLDG